MSTSNSREREARAQEVRQRAARFFERYLWQSTEGALAREQLAARGLRPETLRTFGVGLAPSVKQATLRPALRAGFSLETVRDAGLVYTTPHGKVVDRFRGRITFPIRDLGGQTLGFGARATRPEQRLKYINSPRSAVFSKGETLYAGPHARAAIAGNGRALVVEGYLDAIAAHQAGHHNVVASMGTALNNRHADQLLALTDRIVAVPDGDPAGLEAALRFGDLLHARGAELLIADLPVGHDPASVLETGGRADLTAALQQPRPVVEVAVERAVAAHLPLPTDALRRGEAQDNAIRGARAQLDRFGASAPQRAVITRGLAKTLELPSASAAAYLAAAEPVAAQPRGTERPRPPSASRRTSTSVAPGAFARPATRPHLATSDTSDLQR